MGIRSKYILLCVLMLMIAPVSRIYFLQAFLPTFLWAAFFYFFFRILMVQKQPLQIAIFTLAFAVLVEFSQLYHAPILDRLRDVDLVHYLLGNAFDWADILAYIIGILFAYLLDGVILYRLNIK